MQKLNLDNATQVAVVMNNAEYIQYIDYPCIEAQIICLNKCKNNIIFIKHLNEEVAKMFNIIASKKELYIQIEKLLDEYQSLTDEDIYKKLCKKFDLYQLNLKSDEILKIISEIRSQKNMSNKIDSKNNQINKKEDYKI